MVKVKFEQHRNRLGMVNNKTSQQHDCGQLQDNGQKDDYGQ